MVGLSPTLHTYSAVGISSAPKNPCLYAMVISLCVRVPTWKDNVCSLREFREFESRKGQWSPSLRAASSVAGAVNEQILLPHGWIEGFPAAVPMGLRGQSCPRVGLSVLCLQPVGAWHPAWDSGFIFLLGGLLTGWWNLDLTWGFSDPEFLSPTELSHRKA